jgi:hypothetical protein
MNSIIISIKKNNILLNLILFFILTRVFFYFLGLSAGSEHIQHMWQLLSPTLLAENYFKSLLYLHYQPPLWNSIFGVFIKIFGTDFKILSNVLNLFNLFCTLLITVYFYFLCKEFDLTKSKIYLFFFIFIGFSPSVLMYENFIHYTNLSVLFFLQISYYVIKFEKKQNLVNEIKIYIFLILLMYTWSAFSQPLILFLFASILFIIRNKKKYISVILLIICLIISILPSLKNKYFLNHFSNTYGPGLQLMQVLKRYDYQYPLCSFELTDIPLHENIYKKQNEEYLFDHPSLTGKKSRYNSIAFIHRAKSCLPVAIGLIKEDPINFIKIVKFNLISSHGHFAFDFGQKPQNWNEIFGFFDNLKSNKFTNQTKVRLLQLYHLFFHLFFIFIFIKFLKDYKNKSSKKNLSLISIYFLYSWIIFISHVGAGFEFERMRHTGHTLHIIFFILLFKDKLNLYNFFKKIRV